MFFSEYIVYVNFLALFLWKHDEVEGHTCYQAVVLMDEKWTW